MNGGDESNREDLAAELERMRARAGELERLLGDLRAERDESLKLLAELTVAVGTAPDFDAALRAAMRSICTRTGWLLAEAWLPDQTARLELAVTELGPGATVARLESFLLAGQGLSLPPGEGLPGRVFAGVRPEWIVDIQADPDFKRREQARAGGLHAAFGVPVLADGRPDAVLILFTEAPRERDPMLAEIVTAVAAQLGILLVRKRSEALIAKLSREVEELSTPVLNVLNGVALAPLIGALDRDRMEQLSNTLLSEVVRTRAKVALIDITGVPALDTALAAELIQVSRAIGLIGARVVLTGVSPAIARTLVHLGVDLQEIRSHATLAAGLSEAIALTSGRGAAL